MVYLHYTGLGDLERERDWEWNKWVLIYYAEMFSLAQDRERDQDPLFPFVPVPLPRPPVFPVPFSVNKP